MGWGLTVKIFCTTENCLVILRQSAFIELSNLRMNYILFFYKKTNVPNLLTFYEMTNGCQQYAT